MAAPAPTRIWDSSVGVSAVLDELLIENSQALPESLQGRFDATRVGVAGHSYGAVMSGKVLQDDARFKARLIIAAPVESPVLLGVEVATIDEPMLFMIAEGGKWGRNYFISTNSRTWVQGIRFLERRSQTPCGGNKF